VNEVKYLSLLKGEKGIIELYDSYISTTINKDNKYRNIHAMILEFAGLGSIRDLMGKMGRAFEENEIIYFLHQMVAVIKILH
jgi:serine/threonine protein kinase